MCFCLNVSSLHHFATISLALEHQSHGMEMARKYYRREEQTEQGVGRRANCLSPYPPLSTPTFHEWYLKEKRKLTENVYKVPAKK